MPRHKSVILAFRWGGERSQTFELAVGMETVAATREYLVGIRLMSHVPHQPVGRGIEYVVERDGQFDTA